MPAAQGRARRLAAIAWHVAQGDPAALGRPGATGVVRGMVTATIVTANLIGAAIVVILLGVVLPLPPEARHRGLAGLGRTDGILAAAYAAVAVGAGAAIGRRLGRPVAALVDAPRAATAGERRTVLGLPARLLALQVVLWAIAVVLFAGLALRRSGAFGIEVAATTAIAGLTTASTAYLLTQRLLRSVAAAILSDAPPRRREVPGVLPRAMLAWSLGTGPVAGAILVSAFASRTHATTPQLARACIVLAAVGAVVGALTTATFARSVAEPLARLRDAFARIEDGHFDVHVPVYDATEVGYAAAGFNVMAVGLAERARLMDLFGRQVGTDVARQALEGGAALGGEERWAATLFVDVIGSTSFAATRGPQEVVGALNEFFAAVVDVVAEHGGLVNKFLGDAVLCVYGAPVAHPDPAGAALATARAVADRLGTTALAAGVGVSAGTVVAGNVGTAARYEYTVIGDPVNEAARLTELAKARPGRVLASMAAVERAGQEERRWWRPAGTVTVRGRHEPTALAEPVAPA